MPADDSKKNENLEYVSNKSEIGPTPSASIPTKQKENDINAIGTKFLLPSADGSPPKIVTMNELNDVFKSIQNMELVHEIALNPEFKLLPYEPPENSLERKIKEIMHKAFWDMLREQLDQKPPCYDYALQLLADIKECFPQIISANNKKILDHINEVLDITLIKKQAEQGVLDFNSYANFIINIMSKCCAPVRDENIESIKKLTDVVEIFKGILDTMTVMKLDMANCLLEFARKDLVAHSVEYEKEKFNEYLEYYKFGFPITENWLKKSHIIKADGQKSTLTETIFIAYMNLLHIYEEKDVPEILKIDKERILKLNMQAVKLCTCASIISLCSAAVPIILQNAEHRQSLATQVYILIQGCVHRTDIEDLSENIWIQVLTFINKCMADNSQVDNKTQELLKTQLISVIKRESAVYSLMWERLDAFLRFKIRSKGNSPPTPSGYTEFKAELESFASTYKRIMTYNYSVFGDYYAKVLSGTSQPISNSGET